MALCPRLQCLSSGSRRIVRDRFHCFVLVSLWAGVAVWAGTGHPSDGEIVVAMDKTLELGLDRLDAAGLYGPPHGKRALDYEYCIPAGPGFLAEVAAIDPSARFQASSPGRVGCGSHEVLVLGNTHQVGFRDILARLAELPYVVRIAPAWFE